MEETQTEDEARNLFEQQLERTRSDERRSGTTMVGPHRDELEFSINGMTLKHHASQGQHKTIQISLKTAEYQYLRECCRETPILLLDDVFSELDADRSERMIGMLNTMGQAFITATGDEMLRGQVAWGGGNRKFSVQQGSVLHEEAAGIVQ